jgi:hypothetical protein
MLDVAFFEKIRTGSACQDQSVVMQFLLSQVEHPVFRVEAADGFFQKLKSASVRQFPEIHPHPARTEPPREDIGKHGLELEAALPVDQHRAPGSLHERTATTQCFGSPNPRESSADYQGRFHAFSFLSMFGVFPLLSTPLSRNQEDSGYRRLPHKPDPFPLPEVRNTTLRTGGPK